MATGGAPSTSELSPGKLIRFATSDRHGDESGWCKLFPDGQGGVFGCWRQGINETWQARGFSTHSERLAFNYKTRQARAEAAQIDAARRAECRGRSQALWGQGQEVDVNHPYIVTKKITPYGIKQLKDALLVPVRDIAGTLHGLQFIGPEGKKKFMTGTAVAGCYHPIGRPNGKLLIAEGLATAATLHEITGYAVACAFNAGNLKPVAEALRAKLPTTDLIICADDDHMTGRNPGLTHATDAARAVGGYLALPAFSIARGPKDTDFNDLARLDGPEAVRACIEVALKSSPIKGIDTPMEGLEPFDWPDPIRFTDIEPPDIPCSLLPGWLGDYAAAVVANTQTPAAMAVMLALAVVAACIQKRFQVARTTEHIEPLAVWTATALPPASRKTAVVKAFTWPIVAWEKDRDESGRHERAKIASIREIADNRIKALHAQAVKSDDSAERENLINEACKLSETIPEPLTPPRIFTDDVTAERLQALMIEQGERMAVISDEGGIFAVMAGLYSGGKANIDVFLKGHAGSPVRVDRQGRTAHLDEPSLTFGLCIQPEVLRQLAKTSFRGNGCLARFLFCLPISNIGTRTAHTAPIPELVKKAYQTKLTALLDIPSALNEDGKEHARTISLDHGAAKAWETFFSFMESNIGQGKRLETIQDWAGKLAGAALRIAGIMCVVEQGEAAKEITEATMARSLRLAELLIPHAQTAFHLIEADDTQCDAKHIYEWILARRAEAFTVSEVYKELRRFKDAERLTRALKVLTSRYIISEPKNAGMKGKPKRYAVNPLLLSESSPV